MKRLFIGLSLCVIIAATFGYSGLKLLSVGEDSNIFNRQYRAQLAAYPTVRTILGLHRDGDAKSDYLGNSYDSIKIEVDSMAGLKVPYEFLETLSKKIEAVTGKPTSVLYSDADIPYAPLVSDEAVENIYATKKTTGSKNRVAGLYVLLVSANDTQPDIIGSTLDETGLIVYLDTLSDFTKYNTDLLNTYFVSTLLHEFGHQMGLSHNTEPNCLMNASADQRNTIFESAAEVVSDFCPFEQQRIQQTKMDLN